LGVEADTITISDMSGGNEASGDAQPMEEEASTSLVSGQTPWPAGLRALEEKEKEKEGEEREREAMRPPQEQQQQQQHQQEE